ncbi:helix-turn-helix transcriptional regulator [Vibrio harveyi]
MFFHQVQSKKVTLKPYRSKRSLLVRISNYQGFIAINGNEVSLFNNSLLVIPEGAMVECDLLRQSDESSFEVVTLNKTDIKKMKVKLEKLNDLILNKNKNESFILYKSKELCEIFYSNRQLNNCQKLKSIKNIALKQSIFHLVLLLYKKGVDVSILFNSDYHISLSSRLAKLFMSEPTKKWTLDLAASCMFTSPSTLRRNLSKEGGAFSHILNDVRLGISINYLTFTSYNVLKISELSGFNSSAYFCTIFKKKYGVTPQEFRKNSKENNI